MKGKNMKEEASFVVCSVRTSKDRVRPPRQIIQAYTVPQILCALEKIEIQNYRKFHDAAGHF